MDNQNQPFTASPITVPPVTPPPPQTPPAPVPPGISSSFPSISQLFKDSWQTFIHSILPLFLLNIIGIVIYFGLAVLAILIFILSGAGSFLLKNGLQGIVTNLPAAFSGPNFITLIIVLVVLAVIFGLISIIVSAVLQIASIIIVDNGGKAPLGNTLRRSLGLVIPLSLVSLLTFFLTFGAFFLLILPALLFYFLLAFVQFEVILNNQRWAAALKRSVTIVSKHFGAILIRLILLILIYLAYTLITNLLSKIGPDTAILVGILSFIINLLLSWFSLAYTITLYKQARAGLEQEPGKGIAWMWAVALIGWLIAISLGFVTYKTLSSGVLNQIFNKPTTTTNMPRTLTSTDSSSMLQSALSKINKAVEISKKQDVTKEEDDQKIQLLAQAYSEIKDITIKDPTNVQAWLHLGQLEIILKRKDEARKDLEKALELLPKDDPIRAQIENGLNSL